MIVKEKGRYRVLKDLTVRMSISVYFIEKNTVLNITQIDEKNEKVIGSNLPDWVAWELPVEKEFDYLL